MQTVIFFVKGLWCAYHIPKETQYEWLLWFMCVLGLAFCHFTTSVPSWNQALGSVFFPKNFSATRSKPAFCLIARVWCFNAFFHILMLYLLWEVAKNLKTATEEVFSLKYLTQLQSYLTSLGSTYFSIENIPLSSGYQHNFQRNLIPVQICEAECLVGCRRKAFWTCYYS